MAETSRRGLLYAVLGAVGVFVLADGDSSGDLVGGGVVTDPADASYGAEAYGEGSFA